MGTDASEKAPSRSSEPQSTTRHPAGNVWIVVLNRIAGFPPVEGARKRSGQGFFVVAIAVLWNLLETSPEHLAEKEGDQTTAKAQNAADEAKEEQ